MLFFTNDGHSKRKTSPTATPFWPQRDLSYGVTTRSLAADRRKDIADSFSHALATFIPYQPAFSAVQGIRNSLLSIRLVRASAGRYRIHWYYGG